MFSAPLFILLLQWSLITSALPKPANGPNPTANLLGPIQSLLAVPNTNTTVTFTKLTDESPSGATQIQSLLCLAQSLTQIYQNISSVGGAANPHDLVLSGTEPENAECLSLRDMDPSDGKLLTYGIVAEALQGVTLQLNTKNYAAADFQVWSGQWGYVGWGSIGMGTGKPVQRDHQSTVSGLAIS